MVVPPRQHHLSICSGLGGLDLTIHLALRNARTVCYIERDAYAAATLVARMEEQALDPAPIWDDLTTFNAGPWRGKVDIISAGFPCQPFSHAGKQQGTDDGRWIWPAIEDIIRTVRPRLVFLENVAALLNDRGAGRVFASLAALGYDAEWTVLGAGEVGAPHQRDRVFILAYRNGFDGGANEGRPDTAADGRDESTGRGEELGDADESGLERRRPQPQRTNKLPPWPPAPENQTAWRHVLDQEPSLEPALCRMADGAPYWVEQSPLQGRPDRLRGLGNAVVPVQAAVAFIHLAKRLGLEHELAPL